ncbi:MAG: Single-stranded DNA-binding protein [Candidatus Kaiserbacteria bacterium GW2011_GWC2_52_8b]|uniref:Single-stranded DNA-binding protein n=1 Tax=Candidatus Kaiserbacteria bacterium GW2011_GWC2_52_8b TaxID=1618676 RepID=A0A0G1ZNC1_9BACT|nr:MAG: Single-stranded DNA-binding protein [Candidatus Kaiserbacteria bacterium GW2011_GWC2_52_8b]
MYLNKAMVFGNITRDPELRALPSGMNVCSFSVATNRVYRDRDGKKQEQADFHNVVVFGRQADVVAQYLKKGSSVFVEGRMQTRSWEGKDGEKKYRTEIVADRVQFGPRAAADRDNRKIPWPGRRVPRTTMRLLRQVAPASSTRKMTLIPTTSHFNF